MSPHFDGSSRDRLRDFVAIRRTVPSLEVGYTQFSLRLGLPAQIFLWDIEFDTLDWRTVFLLVCLQGRFYSGRRQLFFCVAQWEPVPHRASSRKDALD